MRIDEQIFRQIVRIFADNTDVLSRKYGQYDRKYAAKSCACELISGYLIIADHGLLLTDYEQWVKFFLEAIYASATDAADAIIELAKLHDDNMAVLTARPDNKNILALFDYIERNPIIDTSKTAEDLGVAYKDNNRAVRLRYLRAKPKGGQAQNVFV